MVVRIILTEPDLSKSDCRLKLVSSEMGILIPNSEVHPDYIKLKARVKTFESWDSKKYSSSKDYPTLGFFYTQYNIWMFFKINNNIWFTDFHRKKIRF